MQPNPGNVTLSIPVSAYPPVSLARPLSLFGKKFEVHISTGLTLSPHTMLQSALGLSLQQLMREDKDRPDRHLKALLRAGRGRNKPTDTTRKLVKQAFGRFLPSDALDAVLDGNEPTDQLPWQSAWEACQLGLGKPGEDDLSQLIARLAQLDRVAYEVQHLSMRGSKSESAALLAQYIGEPQQYWSQHSPNPRVPVMFLVDISLQTLAWLEWRGLSKPPLEGVGSPKSKILSLLEQGKKPIGHWLLRMQKAASCKNLKVFGDLLMQKEIKRHSYFVSHDLLKKWSCGEQLMPVEACEAVLHAVRGLVDAEREKQLFAATRFLSFLCDLLIAGTEGEPPLWAAVQGQLRNRYSELYGLEATRG